MIRPSVFRRYLFISVSVTVLFLALGYLAFRGAEHFERENRPQSGAPLFYAQLVQELGGNNSLRGAQTLARLNPNAMRFDLTLLDSQGHSLFSTETKAPQELELKELPEKIMDAKALFHDDNKPPETLVRLNTNPATYLLLSFRRPRSGPPALLVSIGFVAISAVLASVFCIFLLFISLREKAQLADSVLTELQKGNLGARFPIRKMDEIGQAMLRFNLMADEIQRLVERLQTAEKSRSHLLQDLAHDLRTPIASLKSLLETQVSKRKELPEEVQLEFAILSLKEVDYFERLVEDLLFMAQVSEPRYHTETIQINVAELLEEEMSAAKARHNRPGSREIQGRIDINPEQSLPGDPHLLKRLFRNALENAFSFAQHEVVVVGALSEENSDKFEIKVQDDGPGLSEEASKEFGQRYSRRAIESDGRVSVGLGSVIMKAIALLHRGDVSIGNRMSQERVLGSELKIVLPRGL